MRIAVAHYNLNNSAATREALQKAVGFDETRKQAGDWLRHLGGETTADASAQVASNKGS